MRKGVSVDKGDNGRYNTLDTLANAHDFEALFETLSSFKDAFGNTPVFTPMVLSVNPDFEKIEKNNFTSYYYKSLIETLKDYGQKNAFAYWKEGEKHKLFTPEFHGREHLNVRLWLKALQRGDKDTHEAFKEKCWGFKSKSFSNISFQAAFDVFDIAKDIPYQKEIIKDGVKCFEELFKRPPKYFVPPNGAINQQIIDVAVENNLKYVSSSKIHIEPLGYGKSKKRFRYLGKKGRNGLIYMTRNCFFEPSYPGKGYSKEDCLQHISTAFKFNKPAVISTHRVNYVGGLNEKNRIEGNKALSQLLVQILKRWPVVEFMTSTQLAETIRND
jgi:hypothetical protein